MIWRRWPITSTSASAGSSWARRRLEQRHEEFFVLDESDRNLGLVTVSQAAEELNVRPNTIRAWVARGKLIPIVVDDHGPMLFYRREVLACERDTRTRRKGTQASYAALDPTELQDHLGDLVTTSQAAELLKLKPGTIRQWISRGHLQPVSREGHTTLRLVDVVKVMRDHQTRKSFPQT